VRTQTLGFLQSYQSAGSRYDEAGHRDATYTCTCRGSFWRLRDCFL
jgi:hypothetical protein